MRDVTSAGAGACLCTSRAVVLRTTSHAVSSQTVSERRLVNDEIVGGPTPAGARRWRRWGLGLAAYAALLAASAVVRSGRADPPPQPGEHRIPLTAPGPRTPTATDPPRAAVTIAFERRCPAEGGAGATPVLLLHGSPGGRFDFEGMLDALARDRCAIALDLPGFGTSSRAAPDYGIHAHAAYADAFLDALRIPRAHVAGYSMGGGVAIALADRAPERVASLALLAGLGVQEQELFGRYHVNHAIHGIQLAGLWLLVEATPHFGVFDRLFLGVEYARNFYDTDQRPLRPALLAYDGPALVHHGRHDFLVPLDAALEHHRLLPQSELVVTDGDHFDVFARPAPVAAALARFLRSVDAGSALRRAQAPADRRATAAAPYAGPIGTAHIGARLLVEAAAGALILAGLGAWGWRRRRRLRPPALQ
jgi:pimeloyl-ACP methyl ester carboxylesterase